MEPRVKNGYSTETDIKNSLLQIKQYLEKTIRELTAVVEKKDAEITQLKYLAGKTRDTMEGNSQLINKLLGDLSKLQNDLDWYKRTYEKRSFLGTIRTKLFKK